MDDVRLERRASSAADQSIGSRAGLYSAPARSPTLRIIDKILGRKESLPNGSFDVTEIDLKTLTPQV